MALGILAACAALDGAALAADLSLSPGPPLVLAKAPKKSRAPARPKLLRPLDRARVSGGIAFSWRSSAPRNRLEVSPAADFGTKAHKSVVDGNKATVELAEGAYFWRVTALNEAGSESPPSQARRITVQGAATAKEDDQNPTDESTLELGLGLDLSGGEATDSSEEETDEEEASPPIAVVTTPQVEDPDLRPAPKPQAPAEPLMSKLHLGIALTPSAIFGLPSTYLSGDLELRAAFAALPFLHVMLAAGVGERTFLGAPRLDGPLYSVLGTWHADLGVQVPFGDARQGPFAELALGWRSFTAAPSELGYLGQVGGFEMLAGGGWRMRVAGYGLDFGLRLGCAPGARTALGLQLLVGGWIF